MRWAGPRSAKATQERGHGIRLPATGSRYSRSRSYSETTECRSSPSLHRIQSQRTACCSRTRLENRDSQMRQDPDHLHNRHGSSRRAASRPSARRFARIGLPQDGSSHRCITTHRTSASRILHRERHCNTTPQSQFRRFARCYSCQHCRAPAHHRPQRAQRSRRCRELPWSIRCRQPRHRRSANHLVAPNRFHPIIQQAQILDLDPRHSRHRRPTKHRQTQPTPSARSPDRIENPIPPCEPSPLGPPRLRRRKQMSQ